MLTLTLGFFIVALLYAMVGFGGGSSYIALLAVSSIAYVFIPKISLLCNLIVVTGGCIHFYRKGLFEKKLLLPFVLSSVPMAYIGGWYPIREKAFLSILTGTLVLCGLRLLFLRVREQHEVNPPSFTTSLLVGGVLGLLSGVVGIGGGIFLSPVLINMGWARSKNAAAIASAFIFLNSIAGIAGQLTKDPAMPPFSMVYPLFIAVLLGGQIGSRVGGHPRVSYSLIQKATGVLTLFIGGKLLFQTVF